MQRLYVTHVMKSDILKQAPLEEIILETSDGQRFILAPVEKWKGFQIGEDDDIGKNKELMTHLMNRRSGGKRIPLSEVKKKIGIVNKMEAKHKLGYLSKPVTSNEFSHW